MRSFRKRAHEPKIVVSVTLLQSEHRELLQWAREQSTSMSAYLRWMVQNESVQRASRAPDWLRSAG